MGQHIEFTPIVTVPEAIRAATELAADLRRRVAGKPKEELLDVACLGTACAILTTAGFQMSGGAEGFRACPCPTDKEEQAKVLDSCCEALKSDGYKSFSWTLLLSIVMQIYRLITE
jgi:hypothetical protein